MLPEQPSLAVLYLLTTTGQPVPAQAERQRPTVVRDVAAPELYSLSRRSAFRCAIFSFKRKRGLGQEAVDRTVGK